MANYAKGDKVVKSNDTTNNFTGYDTIKNKIRTEYNRRQNPIGYQAWANVATYTTNPTITVGNKINAVHDADPLNLVKISQDVYVAQRAFKGQSQAGDLIKSGDSLAGIASLYTIVNNLAAATEETTNGGCAAACVGLCIGTCSSKCSGTCKDGNDSNGGGRGNYSFSACSGQCGAACAVSCRSIGESTSSCDGCSAGCIYDCSNACSGCTGSCGSSCANSCSGWCYEGCKDSCKTTCSGCNSECSSGCGTTCQGYCMLSGQ